MVLRSSLLMVTLLAVTVIAHASFELVLVADSSPTGQSRVHRYDGDSGVYLGAFGVSFAPIGQIASDRDTSRVFVSRNTVLDVYDYNTGAQVSSNSFGATILDVAAIEGTTKVAMLLTGGVIRTWDLATNVVATPLTAGSNLTAFTVNEAANCYVTYNYGNDTYVSYTYSGTFIGSIASGFVAGTGGTMAMDGTRATWFGRNNVPTTTFGYCNVSASGNLGSVASATLPTLTNLFGASSGHNGSWIAGTTGGVNVLQRRWDTYGTLNQQISLSAVSSPGEITVITAPEPATFLMFGLGAAALLKRKRKA
jgi:hypothetical protein